MKLLVIPTTRNSQEHPYYPLTATGNEQELITVINQVILDDEELETASVVAELAGILPDDAPLSHIVNWVNRVARDIEVQLEIND